MQTYEQYLRSTFQKIYHHCVEDESIQILKTMDNKEYLLLRIEELFKQIYSHERQNTIQELFTRVNTVEPQRESQLQVKKSLSIPEKPTQEQKMLECEEYKKLKERVQTLEHHNLHLEKLHKSSGLTLTHTQEELLQCKSQVEKITTDIANTRQKYRRGKEQKERIFCQLDREKKKTEQMQAKIKQMTIKIEELQNQINYDMKVNVLLQKEKQELQTQINRKQSIQIYDKQLISKYEQELALLNKKLTQISPQLPTYVPSDGESLINLSKKEEKIIQLLREKKQLENELNKANFSFSEHKLQSERSISQQKEQYKKLQIKYEKQIRIFKEQQINYLQKVQQSKKQEIKYLEKHQKRLRDNEFASFQQRIYELQEENKMMKKQIEKIEQLHRKAKEIDQEEIKRLENIIETLKKLDREKDKELTFLKSSDHNFEQELNHKIGYQEKQMKYLAQQMKKQQKIKKQLEESLISNQEYLKSIELKNIQLLKQKNLIEEKLHEEEISHKNLNQSLRIKEKQIGLAKKRYEQNEEKCAQLRQKNKYLQEKNLKMHQKIKESQKDLMYEKQKSIKQQAKNKEDIASVYETCQKNMEKSRKQTQAHYQALLQKMQKKSSCQEAKFDASSHRSIIYELQKSIDELTDRNKKLSEIISVRNNQISCLNKQLRQTQDKVKIFKEQISKKDLKIEEQEQSQLYLVQYYEEKILAYHRKFKEFKFQFCFQVHEIIIQLKKKLFIIKEEIMIMKNTFIRQFRDAYRGYLNINDQVEKKLQQKWHILNNYYEYDLVNQYQNEKKDLIHEQEKKIKQKGMEAMLEIAEKQYEISTLKQQYKALQNKYSQTQHSLNGLNTTLLSKQSSTSELREVIKKLEQKLYTTQQQCLNLESIKKQYEEKNQFQNEKIKKMDEEYRIEFRKMQERCMKENQKMFGRYQKEVSRMIALNKKTKQIKSENDTMMVPTRGQEDRVHKLKKQIYAQKKKLQKLEKKRDI